MAVESLVRSWSYKLQNAFLKKSKTFRTRYTFVKIIPLNYSGREEQALKKICLTLNLGMLSILFLVLYAVLAVGFIGYILRGLIFSCLKEIAKFSKQPSLL